VKTVHFFVQAALAISPLLAQEATPTATPAASATPTPTPPPAQATPKPSPTPPPPTPTTRQVIDKLSDAQLDQAIQSLRAGYLDASQTDDQQLRRATLEGLLSRLAPGLTITTDAAIKQASTGGPGFLAEILDSRIGYVRLGAISHDALAQMDTALASFKEKQIYGVILDLRGAPASTDYEMAAEFARRFCPKGSLLFTVQKPSAKQERILTSNQDPSFSGVLVILTDKKNSGAAEALAAALRHDAHAMIVGATTRGEAVEFSDVALGDGRTLRIAVAQVVLPEVGTIFPDGVAPDIAATLDPAVQARIFTVSKEKGVSQFVFETERPHFNEAALVANTNPEIDPDVMQPDDHHALWDTVLQRAVDLVTAIRFYDDRGPKKP
jgi:C-terminal processing protease CtpA/Prc